MRKLFSSIPLVVAIFAVLGLSSCEKKNSDPGMGKLEISLNLSDDQGMLKSAVSDSFNNDTSVNISYHLLVSIEDMDGNPVLSDELIPMYQFGNGFVSEDVELRTGEYKLTKFMVINPAGQVIFASPLAGSPLAYLVNRPLPFNFVINSERVTRILPEVLPVLNLLADQFGYISFGVQIIKPLSFHVICILDNPLIMAPTQMTQAKLTIHANNNWHYAFKLEAMVNRLVIRGGSEIYTFILEKEGYQSQTMQFNARQLMATSEENPLVLKIPWGGDYKTLILQPGPDHGKDAMISNLEPNKNFGTHKYFEATFLPEPVLTVMRSNRSMIWFDMNVLPKSAVIQKVILSLSYDIPIPWDSTINTLDPTSSGFAWYGAVLQQIVEPWEEGRVTWNTQPKSIEANQVYLSPFNKNANFIDIDVTRLYVPVQEIMAPNYGMLFKLYPSEQFPGFRFASSDYPVPGMRPKLIIHYTLPVIVNE